MTNNSLSKGLFLPKTHMIRRSNQSEYSTADAEQLHEFLQTSEPNREKKRSRIKGGWGLPLNIEDAGTDLLATQSMYDQRQKVVPLAESSVASKVFHRPTENEAAMLNKLREMRCKSSDNQHRHIDTSKKGYRLQQLQSQTMHSSQDQTPTEHSRNYAQPKQMALPSLGAVSLSSSSSVCKFDSRKVQKNKFKSSNDYNTAVPSSAQVRQPSMTQNSDYTEQVPTTRKVSNSRQSGKRGSFTTRILLSTASTTATPGPASRLH